MSMHIEGPWLSSTGRTKTKRKFRSASEAKQARELDASWQALKSKWDVPVASKKKAKPEPLNYKLTTPPGRETAAIPSRDTGHKGAVSSKPTPRYTGNNVLGISQMAKSNAVPVFNTDHIVEIGKMRR